jgi:hypothetical protein
MIFFLQAKIVLNNYNYKFSKNFYLLVQYKLKIVIKKSQCKAKNLQLI